MISVTVLFVFPPPLAAPSLIAIITVAIVPLGHIVVSIVGLEVALLVFAAPRVPLVVAIPVTVTVSERCISE